MTGAVVNADRGILVRADDGHYSAASTHAAGLTSAKTRTRLATAANTETWLVAAASLRAGSRLRSWLVGANGQRQKILTVGGILPFLPQISPLNERVDAGRILSGILDGIEVDRARVLFAAKGELRFLLPLHLLPPHRQQRGHHDRHDRDAYQHRRQRVSPLAALTL
jgi:hypothetical protein